MRTVRLKNRFEHDAADRISAARLQQEFYAAEAWGFDDADSVASGDSGREAYDKMYRDVLLNIEVPRKGGPPFVAELQVALSGIAILKKSEQVVYTIMRMKRPADLLSTFVFDHEDFTVNIDMPEPGSPKPEAEGSVALPLPGPSRPLPRPGTSAAGNVGLAGLEETAATGSLLAAQAQRALPQAALATMSEDELKARDDALAAQLSALQAGASALQAERDRIAVARNVALLAGPSGGDDSQPKACSWFACAPACD
jgi:hypothetical protein